MKSFAIAAMMASSAMALPTGAVTNVIPCIQKELIPSTGLPTGLLSCADAGTDVPSLASVTALSKDLPSLSDVSDLGSLSSLSSLSTLPNVAGASSAVNSVTSTAGAISGLHSVVSVTKVLNNGVTKKVIVELDGLSALALAGAHLGSVGETIGQIIQTAPVVSQLNLPVKGGEGYITIVDTTGSAILVKLNALSASVFDKIGLSDATVLIGTIIGTLDGFLQSFDIKKRGNPLNILSDLESIPISNTGVTSVINEEGDLIPVQLYQGLLGSLLSTIDLNELSSIGSGQAAIGTIVARAESLPELAKQLPLISQGEGVFVGLLNNDGYAVLVQIEEAFENFLSTLGLASLGSAAGVVIGTATSAAGGAGLLSGL